MRRRRRGRRSWRRWRRLRGRLVRALDVHCVVVRKARRGEGAVNEPRLTPCAGQIGHPQRPGAPAVAIASVVVVVGTRGESGAVAELGAHHLAILVGAEAGVAHRAPGAVHVHFQPSSRRLAHMAVFSTRDPVLVSRQHRGHLLLGAPCAKERHPGVRSRAVRVAALGITSRREGEASSTEGQPLGRGCPPASHFRGPFVHQTQGAVHQRRGRRQRRLSHGRWKRWRGRRRRWRK